MKRPRNALLAIALVAAVAACGGGDDDGGADTSGATELVGLFTIAAGECTADGASGSSFRMVQPGGTVEDGPFVANGDSPCEDKTWTPLAPGTDGGLRTGTHQPPPDPPFDEAGSSTSAAVIQPQPWFAVAFGVATGAADPQSGTEVPPPTITADGAILSGDLRAFAVSWNGQHFNQGAPKPDGSEQGATSGPTGSYDDETGEYTLRWTSQIVGGPFNNFTGVWQLEGTFESSG